MLGTHLAPRTWLVGHQLHHLGVVWSILDDVEKQLGARLLKLSHLHAASVQSASRSSADMQAMFDNIDIVEHPEDKSSAISLLKVFTYLSLKIGQWFKKTS